MLLGDFGQVEAQKHTHLRHIGWASPSLLSSAPLSLLQLLEEVKRVNFSRHHRQIYFDASGDPLTGYDIVSWNWTGPVWSYSVIGSFDRNPYRLSIDRERILWHTEDKQVVRHIWGYQGTPGFQRGECWAIQAVYTSGGSVLGKQTDKGMAAPWVA